jgi:adenosyl cobinamide kinase/adenosyl cobinamide phosphate guanylyltransferase
VPIDYEDRTWRDVCGRLFQDTALQCDEVELIWYGINRKLK